MAFNTLFFIFAVIFVGAIVVFLVTTIGMSMVFRRNAKTLMDLGEKALEAEQRRKVLDVVAELPPGSPAYKCKACGATVDSTAELSSDGRVRCNYCNQWTSIYQ